MPLREIIAVMRRVYCGKIGTEYRHISSPDREVLDPRAHRRRDRREPLLAEVRAQSAAREAHRGRGVRALPRHEVPRPAALLRRGRATRRSRCSTGSSRAPRAAGSTRSSIGMSHRGRLNILANVVGNSAERIFTGFEGVVHPDFPADEGDVKYHQGARTVRQSESGPRRSRSRSSRTRRTSRPSTRSSRASCAPSRSGMAGHGPDGLEARAAGAAPRRRGVRRAGDGRRGPQPRAAAGLPHGRHDPRRHQQPDRLHDAAVEGPLVGLLDGRREDQPGPDLPRQRRRSRRPRTACSRSRSTTARSSTRTSSST